MSRRITLRLAVAALFLATFSTQLCAQASTFIRGDSNQDAVLDISDAVLTLGILFLGEENPDCDDALDANDSGGIDLSDAVYALAFLFSGGPALPAPFPDCGEDPTADELLCNNPPEDCEPIAVECLDQPTIDQLLADNVPPVVCIPPDDTTIEFDNLRVVVCPGSDAQVVCDELGSGCPVNLDSISAQVDATAREFQAEVTGSIVDLPIVVENVDLGTTTNCTVTVEFSGNAIVPFEVADDGMGNLAITMLLDGSFEDVEVNLTASGGFLCTLLQSLQDLFIDQLVGELETASLLLLADLETELAGRIICPEE